MVRFRFRFRYWKSSGSYGSGSARLERKNLKDFSIWPTINWARARFTLFSALGECAYFHCTPSPTAHILIPHLLLVRLFSFRAFPYYAYFHSAPSPTALIFIPRLLLWRLFSFRAFSYDAYFRSAPSPMTLFFSAHSPKTLKEIRRRGKKMTL